RAVPGPLPGCVPRDRPIGRSTRLTLSTGKPNWWVRIYSDIIFIDQTFVGLADCPNKFGPTHSDLCAEVSTSSRAKYRSLGRSPGFSLHPFVKAKSCEGYILFSR